MNAMPDKGDDQPRDPAEQAADTGRGLGDGSKSSSASYLTHDLELAKGDLEDKSCSST